MWNVKFDARTSTTIQRWATLHCNCNQSNLQVLNLCLRFVNFFLFSSHSRIHSPFIYFLCFKVILTYAFYYIWGCYQMLCFVTFSFDYIITNLILFACIYASAALTNSNFFTHFISQMFHFVCWRFRFCLFIYFFIISFFINVILFVLRIRVFILYTKTMEFVQLRIEQPN